MVFVSYSTVDQKAAEAVCASLEAAGMPCWIAPRNILVGENWASSIVDALESCEVMVLVFSGQVNSSPYIDREVNYVQRRGAQLAIFRVDEAEPGRPFRLFESEFAQALPSDRAFEDRLSQLRQTVQKLLSGAAPDSTRLASRPGMQADAIPPKLFSRLFHVGLLTVVFVTRNTAVISAVALSGTGRIGSTQIKLAPTSWSAPLRQPPSCLLTLIVLWFASRVRDSPFGRTGADTFLNAANIVAPGRLVGTSMCPAMPNADPGRWLVVRPLAALCGAHIRMPVSRAPQSWQLRAPVFRHPCLWAVSICLFRVFRNRVERATRS
jgi:hypothetical protein